MLVHNQLFQKKGAPLPQKTQRNSPFSVFPLNQFDLQTKEKVKGVSNSGLKIWGIKIYPFLLVWSSQVACGLSHGFFLDGNSFLP